MTYTTYAWHVIVPAHSHNGVRWALTEHTLDREVGNVVQSEELFAIVPVNPATGDDQAGLFMLEDNPTTVWNSLHEAMVAVQTMVRLTHGLHLSSSVLALSGQAPSGNFPLFTNNLAPISY